jgi:hypothetical protein
MAPIGRVFLRWIGAIDVFGARRDSVRCAQGERARDSDGRDLDVDLTEAIIAARGPWGRQSQEGGGGKTPRPRMLPYNA